MKKANIGVIIVIAVINVLGFAFWAAAKDPALSIEEMLAAIIGFYLVIIAMIFAFRWVANAFKKK